MYSYKEMFDQYAKRLRIYKCGPHFGPVSDTDHADVFVKVLCGVFIYSLNDLVAMYGVWYSIKLLTYLHGTLLSDSGGEHGNKGIQKQAHIMQT